MCSNNAIVLQFFSLIVSIWNFIKSNDFKNNYVSKHLVSDQATVSWTACTFTWQLDAKNNLVNIFEMGLVTIISNIALLVTVFWLAIASVPTGLEFGTYLCPYAHNDNQAGIDVELTKTVFSS